jgi:hypothetical protein
MQPCDSLLTAPLWIIVEIFSKRSLASGPATVVREHFLLSGNQTDEKSRQPFEGKWARLRQTLRVDI